MRAMPQRTTSGNAAWLAAASLLCVIIAAARVAAEAPGAAHAKQAAPGRTGRSAPREGTPGAQAAAAHGEHGAHGHTHGAAKPGAPAAQAAGAEAGRAHHRGPPEGTPGAQAAAARGAEASGGEPGKPPSAEQLRAARRALWRSLGHADERPDDVPVPVRAELRKHAQRMARLQRIRTLAIGQKDQASAARTDKLFARELARHRAALAKLWPPAPRAATAAADKNDEVDDPGDQEPEDEEEPEAPP